MSQQDPTATGTSSSEYGRFDDENDAPGGGGAGAATSISSRHTAARDGASLMDRLQVDTNLAPGQTQDAAATDYSRFGDTEETSGNDNDNTNNDDAAISPAEKLKGVVRQRIQFRCCLQHHGRQPGLVSCLNSKRPDFFFL